jgi:hypothetical protein
VTTVVRVTDRRTDRTLGGAYAALVIVLNAGSYTVRVSGVGGTTGIALVQVYEF